MAKKSVNRKNDGNKKDPQDLSKLIPKLKNMYIAGFTERQILETLSIGVDTLAQVKKSEGFNELRHLWKNSRIDNVENRLYEKCMGFKEKTTSDQIAYYGGDNGGFEVTQLEKETYYPPDYNSIKLYLTNKDPDNWKDRSELVVDNTKNLSMDQLEDKVKNYLKQKRQKKLDSIKRAEDFKKGVKVE